MPPTFIASRTSIKLRGKAIAGAEDRQAKIAGFDQEVFSKSSVVCVGAGGGSGAGKGRERGVGAGRGSAGGGDWSGAGIDGPDLSSDSRILTVGAFVGTPTTVAAWNTVPHSSHDVAPAETIAPQFGHS